MANSVLIKLQAENNLSPELEKTKKDLAEAKAQVEALDKTLKSLKNEKKSIVAGDIKSEIDSIKKLQTELENLKKSGAKSDQIKAKRREIELALNNEIQKTTENLSKQNEAYMLATVTGKKLLTQKEKENRVRERTVKGLKDENAVRNSNVNTVVRHIRQLETLVVSVYALNRAYNATLGSGIALHRQIESQTAGISALITANTRLASGTNDLKRHFQTASDLAKKTMMDIKKASVETAATFPELTAIFQQAIGGALGSGKAMGENVNQTIQNTITLAKRMSNIASAIGMPMQQVNEEIRSIIEGTIDINSRIAKMIGITSDSVKKAKEEANGLVKYLDEKLKAFDMLADLQSFDRMLARIKDKVDNIKLDATSKSFEQLKIHLVNLDKWLQANSEKISSSIATATTAITEKLIPAIVSAGKFLYKWKDEIYTALYAFGAIKLGGWVIGGLEGVAGSIAKAAKKLGLLTAGVTGATRALNLLKAAAFAARGALVGIAIWGLVEGVSALSKKAKENKVNFEELNKVLERTNEEIKKLTAPELSGGIKTIDDSNEKIKKQIENIKKQIKEYTSQEFSFGDWGAGGSDLAIEELKKELQALEAQLQTTAEKKKIYSKASEELKQREDELKKSVESVTEALIQQGKIGENIPKLLEKYAEVFDDNLGKNIVKTAKDIVDLSQALATLMENPEKNAEAIEKYLEVFKNAQTTYLNQQKEASDKEAEANKKRLEEAKKFIKEKLDAQINYYKTTGQIDEQHKTELKKREMELNEQIENGLITLDQKKEILHHEELKRINDRKKAEQQLTNELDKEFDDVLKQEFKIYEELGNYQEAYKRAVQLAKKEVEEMFRLAPHLMKEASKLVDKKTKQMMSGFEKTAKKAFKNIKGSWADTVSTMQKTVEEGFFDFFIGKTKSLKDALKGISTNLLRDFISPYARGLSQGIGGLFGSFLGGGSNLASLASFYGLSKSDTGSFVGEVAGTAVEIASNGEIIKGGSAFGGASNILSMASNLKSAYTMLTNGYSGLVSNFTTAPAGYLSSYLSSAGYTGASFGIQGLGVGAQHALTGNLITGGGLNGTLSGAYGAGYIGGATLAGGALGYGVGTLGDKLFKANSYASSVGAVGGALGGAASAGAFGAKIGSMVGPWGAVIGAVAGALIGGMFGKKKAIGSGISVEQDFTSGTNLNSEYIRSYVQMQKKGWFSKKEWKDYHDLGADILGDISSQVKQMERLALRAGAITGLTIKKGAYSGNSFSDTAITKAIISAMTGLDQEIWAEQISTTKKRKGFLGKLTNVYDKIMKYSPSTLANKATRPLDNALGRIMNKNGLGALHDQSIAGRVEIGDISDGKILDFEPTKKLEEKLGIIQEIQTKNMRQIVNPEIERMFQDWQEIAKKEKKNINEVITASLVSITDTYKSLALISQKNPLKQAQINIELMFEEFKDAAEGLKVEIPKNLSSIAELSAEEMATAYRKAIANDFTKENIDGLNSLVRVYQEAKKAQDDFTKSIISFTQQIAQTQGSFYQSHGIDTTFLAYQSIHTRLRAVVGALDNELGGLKLNGGDPAKWNKTFLNMTANQMQEFLSSGNTELRKELVGIITEYKNVVMANGGKEGWIKPLADLEAINKQIAALKLAEQAEKTLQLQREQLSVLSVQKSVIEKLGSIAQRIRDSVIDRQTSSINYQFALARARVAWENGDYNSKAFENLSNAANHQQQYFKDTAQTYEEYKLSMLAMAGEIENIADNTTLNDINKGIKRLEEQLKISNQTSEAQLAMLEAQRQQLIQNSQSQIEAMDKLLGDNNPMVRYLKDILAALTDGKKAPEYKGEIENINNGFLTANGAYLGTELDRKINEAYLKVAGRSVEQAGLDYWRGKIQKKELSLDALSGELIKSAIALTGSNNKADWIEWYKAKGFKPLAEGGIVTRPTAALIGEAGYPEAVLPLDGRTLKVDTDNRELERLLREVIYLLKTQGKDMKEMNMTLQNVTDGDNIFVKVG